MLAPPFSPLPPTSSSSSSLSLSSLPCKFLFPPNLTSKFISNQPHFSTVYCSSYTPQPATSDDPSTLLLQQPPPPPPPPPSLPPTPPNLSSPPPVTETKRPTSTNKSIPQIQVPRHKHISVSKSQLLHSLSSFLQSPPHSLSSNNSHHTDSLSSRFLLLSSCLDSILHAEHKSILEEMRADYFSSQITNNDEDSATSEFVRKGEFDSAGSIEFPEGIGNGSVKSSEDGNSELEESPMSFLSEFDLRQLFGSSSGTLKDITENSSTSEVATATRFQRSFMKLLQNAQFEELSARDLMLTSALNTDYLLTLPIFVDWKRASESNAIIFRRGYSTEKQKGLLIVEKLDYLQSKVLQNIFDLISKPLLKSGIWIKEVIQNVSMEENMPVLIKKIQLWVQEMSLFQQLYTSEIQTADMTLKVDDDMDKVLPIWLAAQKAVSRYEGFLSSIGPRGRLLRKFLGWAGFLPSTPEPQFEFDSENNFASEPHLRPVFLSRISLNDIWRPASRTFCGNNVWKMLKVGFSIIFTESTLQEPAFQELILLYTEESGKADIKTRKTEFPSLQLKIYEKIPVPDLPVIFPHKKLSFRILDTVRLDIASIVGLLAYAINYRFEDVVSSPSALMLDVIAVTALIVFLIRVGLGYKQTWDRYQLLVNRTLYEKTLASGFGSIHFLLDASEQQQYKECILAYAILLEAEAHQALCRKSLGEECERFMYRTFKEKVQMPVDEAVNMLIKFGLVLEKTVNGRSVLQIVPHPMAYDTLRQRWESLLH